MHDFTAPNVRRRLNQPDLDTGEDEIDDEPVPCCALIQNGLPTLLTVLLALAAIAAIVFVAVNHV